MITLEHLIQLAGIAQLCLVAGSFFIPKCLNWKNVMGGTNALMRQLFFTYACYILAMHLFFGLICTFGASELLEGGFLGNALCVLMFCWWGTRTILQFFCFERACIPPTKFNKLAEKVLVLMFGYLTVVYAVATWRNFL